MLIELKNTTKIYNQGKPNEVTALHDVSLMVEPRTMTCLQGASGSGKSVVAAEISRRMKIPHIELDALHWRKDGERLLNTNFDSLLMM